VTKLSDPPVAVRPNGSIITMASDYGGAQAFSPQGKRVWSNSRLGLAKGAVPLVVEDGRFFAPAEGHPEDGTSGLYILTRRGKLIRHLARGIPTFGVAYAADGTTYTLVYDPGTAESSVAAFAPSFQEVWRQPLAVSLETYGVCMCLMVGQHGVLFVGDGNTLSAIDARGHSLWHFAKPDGVLSIAERPDGSIAVAGNQWLTVVSEQGRKLFDADIRVRHPIGTNDAIDKPSLVIDGAGTAYVGTADGEVLVVSSEGQLLDRLAVGGYHFGMTPRIMLGPGHALVVNGNDGVLRVYE
jgi:outer membrane protein assembly factor BamB